MVGSRRDGWWACLDEPRGSESGFPRPILIVQADAFSRSRLRTVLGVILGWNLRLVDMPGDVLLPARGTGLPNAVGRLRQVPRVRGPAQPYRSRLRNRN